MLYRVQAVKSVHNDRLQVSTTMVVNSLTRSLSHNKNNNR